VTSHGPTNNLLGSSVTTISRPDWGCRVASVILRGPTTAFFPLKFLFVVAFSNAIPRDAIPFQTNKQIQNFLNGVQKSKLDFDNCSSMWLALVGASFKIFII
jgi:hypothetical protein